MSLTPDQIARFHREGYLVIEDVFPAAELSAIQEACRAVLPAGARAVNIFQVPAVAGLWTDPRLVGIARALLGDPLSYFFEAVFTQKVWAEGEHIAGRHIHHDAKGAPENLFNRLHAAQTATYPAVRFAAYFQDTARQSGGLKVCPGSHLIDSSGFDQRALHYVNLASTPGDLVVFCSRTLHSPYALRPAAEPDLALPPWVEDKAFARMPAKFLPTPAVRETIFIDYVREDALSDLLVKGRALHPDNFKPGLIDYLNTADVVAMARAAGLSLRFDSALVEHAATGAPLPAVVTAPPWPQDWSPAFPLRAELGDRDALRRRYGALQTTGHEKLRDPHMGALLVDR